MWNDAKADFVRDDAASIGKCARCQDDFLSPYPALLHTDTECRATAIDYCDQVVNNDATQGFESLVLGRNVLARIEIAASRRLIE